MMNLTQIRKEFDTLLASASGKTVSWHPDEEWVQRFRDADWELSGYSSEEIGGLKDALAFRRRTCLRLIQKKAWAESGYGRVKKPVKRAA